MRNEATKHGFSDPDGRVQQAHKGLAASRKTGSVEAKAASKHKSDSDSDAASGSSD